MKENIWIYNREKGHVEENGKFICDPRSDPYGEQIACDHNARLCDPPEVWRDVTAECHDNGFNYIFHKDCSGIAGVKSRQQFRLRKVQLWKGEAGCTQQWAFIVERKEPA